MMVIISNFIPTYLKYKYIFFFISISGRIRIRNFFSAEPDPDPWKKIPDPHPCISINIMHYAALSLLHIHTKALCITYVRLFIF